MTISGADPLQTQVIRVRIMENDVYRPRVVVRFRSTSGVVSPDSTLTDAQGFAQTLWYRTSGSDAAVVTVDARTATRAMFREIRLGRIEAQQYTLRVHSGNFTSWFENAPLRHPIVAEIIRAGAVPDSAGRIMDPAECGARRVAFTRITSGSVTPDTLRGNLQVAGVGGNPGRPGCFASAYWTLGDGPGRRHARAALIGNTTASGSVAFEAYARKSPRLIGGIAAVRNGSYTAVKRGGTRTIHVERVLPDGTTISFDSTIAARDTVALVGGGWGPAPILGVSTPVLPRWHQFAATVGVDPRSIDRDWYVGFSLLRIPGGLAVETLPIDLHLLGHFGRTSVVADEGACTLLAQCRTRDDFRWHGIAGLFSVDVSTVVTELIKKLGGM